MERVVGTSLLLQMMRNRVYEVNEEYYLYLNAVEDKLLEKQVISNSDWQNLFDESGLPKEEQHNFNKVWIEAYVRYYFFKKCLRELPNTTDLNAVRRIVTVDDFAYPRILMLKLAYVYGDRIPEYESIVERWVSDEYVVEWLKYESHRKLSDYWDMDFASDNSVFDSVYKYKRVSLEGLDPVKYILEGVENVNDLENLLRFTFYYYNDMPLPRVPLEYVKKEYEWYTEGKEKGILKYLDKMPTSVNTKSLRVALELAIIQKEVGGKDRLLGKDKEHIGFVLHSFWKCLEVYTYRVINDYYFQDEGVDNERFFGISKSFSIKKRYLVYEMKHCKGFPSRLASEFSNVDGEEFTEEEFYKAANKLWKRDNLHFKRVWFEAAIRGFYIPIFIKKKLGQFCNTDELLMNITINDLADREMLSTLVYYYITEVSRWVGLRDFRLKDILNNNFKGYWYAIAIDEYEDILPYRSMLSKSMPERGILFMSLEADDDECNRYLISNDKFSILSNKLANQFRIIANFRLFLESRLYGDLIDIDEIRTLLQEYPDYILNAFNKIVENGMTKFSRESIDTILHCSLDYYLEYVMEKGYVTGSGMLELKNEHLKSLTKEKPRVSNAKAADIFFGKR
jgi:hypothetical protein